RELESDLWSNVPFQANSHPYGAGMCVRRDIALAWVDLCKKDFRRLELGRVGNRLLGGEDADIAYTSCSLGFGNGVFRSLKLIHLINSTRLTVSYLLRLVEDMTCSHHILNYIWGIPLPGFSRSQKLLKRYQWLKIDPIHVRFEKAKERGLVLAHHIISEWGKVDNGK